MIDQVSYANAALSYARVAQPKQSQQSAASSQASQTSAVNTAPVNAGNVIAAARTVQSLQLYRTTTETFLNMLDPQQQSEAEEVEATDPMVAVQQGNQRSNQAFNAYMKAQALSVAA